MDMIVTDMEEVINVPLHFCEGLTFVDAPSQVYESEEESNLGADYLLVLFFLMRAWFKPFQLCLETCFLSPVQKA